MVSDSLCFVQSLFILSSWVFIVSAAQEEVCRQSPCEYTLTIRHDRTMLYRPKDSPGKAYQVDLNGTKLQIVESTFMKDDHAKFGEYVDDLEDVITADGVRRTILTVNGKFPGPAIEVEEGAQVVVRVENRLRTDGVSVHWHGIYHTGLMWMDGASQVTQCPIAPFQSFTYRFLAEPVGTHWYHAHNGLQRIDGLSGMLIVHPRGLPTVQHSFNLMISDWMHQEGNALEITNPYSQEKGDKGAGEHLHSHPSVREYGVDGVENAGVAYTSGLINGRGRFDPQKRLPLSRFRVEYRRRYRFRTVNSGAEFSYAISIDGHKLDIVALDGIDIVPFLVDDVIVTPGETVDFEVVTDQFQDLYWLRARTLRDSRNDGIIREVLAIVEYVGATAPGQEPTSQPRTCLSNSPCKSLNCPFTRLPAGMNRQCIDIADMKTKTAYIAEYGLDTPSGDVVELFLNAGFAWGSSINGRKFLQPSAPLYQNDRNFVDCNTVCQDQEMGCVCTGNYSLPLGRTIQLVISNLQQGESLIAHHPMHLHGHSFAVLKTGYGTHSSDGKYIGHTSDIYCANSLCRSPTWYSGRPTLNLDRPPVKNTILVPARGYVVVRFKADNPGRWLFHCHAVTHNVEGMMALLEEGPANLIPPVPANFPTCTGFSWSGQEYAKYVMMARGIMDNVDQVGGMGSRSESPSGNGGSTGGGAMPDNPMTRNMQGIMMVPMPMFIGMLAGGVVLGVFLACLVFCCVYCTKKYKSGKVSLTSL